MHHASCCKVFIAWCKCSTARVQNLCMPISSVEAPSAYSDGCNINGTWSQASLRLIRQIKYLGPILHADIMSFFSPTLSLWRVGLSHVWIANFAHIKGPSKAVLCWSQCLVRLSLWLPESFFPYLCGCQSDWGCKKTAKIDDRRIFIAKSEIATIRKHI